MKPLITIIIAAFLINALPAAAEEWVQAGDSKYFYDRSNITVDRKSGNVLVWVKFAMSDSNIQLFQEKFLAGTSAVDYSRYLYSRIRQGVNCKNRTLTIISGAHYTDTGGVFFTWNNNESKQKEITSVAAPKSDGETLLNDVCKYAADKKMTKN